MGQQSSKPRRVLVVGLDGSGKTCLLRRLVHQESALTPPTHGHATTRVAFDGTDVELIDVGGGEDVRRYWGLYFDELMALVYVIDSADKRRLEEAGLELHRVLTDRRVATLPVLVMANKQDMLDALPSDKLVAALNLSAVRDREWHVQACSARDRRGVDEGFAWVLSHAVKGAKEEAGAKWRPPWQRRP